VTRGGAIALMSVGAAAWVATGLALWRKLPASVAHVMAGAAAAAVGAGALLVQKGPSAGEFVLTMGVLAVFAPLNWRLLLGPSGANARS
jgi:hypothetical protein